MFGESTHGTREFYEWRFKLSMELIEKYDFSFIAVEGDWPPCQRINRFIQNISSGDPITALANFSRWPTWMWNNYEMCELLEKLRSYNQKFSRHVGFHGLDVYSLYESIQEVIRKLSVVDAQLAVKAKELYSCFDQFKSNEILYIRSLYHMSHGCTKEVTDALTKILERNIAEEELYFDITQNAKIIKNAEKYYKTMVTGEDESWNIRDQHMADTLEGLLEHYGKDSKAIVWAHNTHIGDYRATDMVFHGQVNLGGLARQKWGEDEVELVGFTTYSGTVVASNKWDGPIELLEIPQTCTGSLEDLLRHQVHQVGSPEFFLILKNSRFDDYLGHRAIGVVYHPENEARGNYVPTSPSKRYDSLFYFDHTHALCPISGKYDRHKVPETYPFGDRI